MRSIHGSRLKLKFKTIQKLRRSAGITQTTVGGVDIINDNVKSRLKFLFIIQITTNQNVQ